MEEGYDILSFQSRGITFVRVVRLRKEAVDYKQNYCPMNQLIKHPKAKKNNRQAIMGHI